MSQLNVFLQRTITTLLCLTGAFVFFRWLLGPLLPFLLALALSAMAEPLVQRVRRWMGVRRSFAAALVTTLLLAIPGGAAALALVRLGVELRQWSTRLPEMVAGFPAMWNSLLDRMGDKTHRYYRCPGCRQRLRVPRGRGNIVITCPKCHREFTKRT